ncbi:Kelch motif family protein [Tritrichomonas foetus]|uniref:Kelch motif family protein n=1 Tax=Tritrichomonas foetus TaxID=1144522 RepID=A0A1J4J7F0_9EUKA|nr:Kelch motif family protein [Tritrichomonas foetus]|eukprot:OHS95158.1 Kelch motif family protein [Tritrichomonas foetus]
MKNSSQINLMGNENSREQLANAPDVTGEDIEHRDFQQTKYKHMEDVGNDLFGDDDDNDDEFDAKVAADPKSIRQIWQSSKVDVQSDLTKMPYNGYWLSKLPTGRAMPFHRTDHFTARYNDDICYVGLGKSHNGNLINDIWQFNNITNSWTPVETKTAIPPRYGSSAAMMGRLLVIFGGGDSNKLYNDLITVNLDDGTVAFVDTMGQRPPPMVKAPMAIYGKKVCVYGGSQGLFILDIEHLQWRCIPKGFQHSINDPFCTYGNKIYAIPEDTEKRSFIVINMETETVSLSAEWKGSGPNRKNKFCDMICIGDYIFYFGGEHQSLVYACYLNTTWWFIFFVIPDVYQSTMTQGKITSDGLFKIPLMHSNSVMYNSRTREISIFLGFPFHDFVPTGFLRIGDEALNFCHLREDMTQALEFQSQM